MLDDNRGDWTCNASSGQSLLAVGRVGAGNLRAAIASDLAPESATFGKVCVVGLGYVGLPTACMLAVSGVPVLGVDSNPAHLAALVEGRFHASEPEVTSLVRLAVSSGNLEFAAAPESCDAYILAVPTPIHEDRTADLRFVKDAVEAVARVARPGSLVVLESTVPPGTMRDLVIPILRQQVGERTGVMVAHCPERVLPGATMLELVNNDRVIGGIDPESAARAAELYSVFVHGAIHLTDLTTAEMVKVMENTYRDVNIALANEFAMLSDRVGIDVWEAIRLANNHPRVNILRPGPGVGGHCVAVDPWFMVAIDPPRAKLVATARNVNDAMPAYVVQLITNQANLEHGHIALLGLAYRADLGDTRESPAITVHDLLTAAGHVVKAHDPIVAGNVGPIVNHTLADAVRGATAIVLVTDHRAFVNLDPLLIADLVGSRIVLDTRACLDESRWNRAGFRVVTLGRTHTAGG